LADFSTPPHPRIPALYRILGVGGLACFCFLAYWAGAPARKSASEVERYLDPAEPSQVTFFKLDPLGPPTARAGKFHDWAVASERRMAKDEARELKGILTSAGTYSSDGLHCFDPGMGFRFEKESVMLDLAVCLSCRKIRGFPGNGRYWDLSDEGSRRLESIYKAQAP